MRKLAVLTLYNPPSDFVENIFSYLNFVDSLFIIENSSIPYNIDYFLLKQNSKVNIHSSSLNVGVASAFNLGIDFFNHNCFDTLLLMDQDSKFIDTSIFDLVEQVFLDKSVGILSASSSEQIDKRLYISNYDINFYQQKLIMTSGSFLSKSLIKSNKYYEDSFFLDEVDHEYSLRSFHAGFKNLVSKKVYLIHSVGDKTILFSIFFGKKNYGLHPPFRYGFIFKNSIKLVKLYFIKDVSFTYHTIIRLLKIIFNLLFYFPNKLAYFKAILKSFK